MNLHTNRLNFRIVSQADLHDVHALNILPETDRYNTAGIPESTEATVRVIDGWCTLMNTDPQATYVFCLESADTKQFIGMIGLKMGKPNYRNAEVWYKLHPDHWGNGYATEAVLELLRFAFDDLKLHRVEAGCAVENTASIRVLEKAGMKREGHCRKKLPIRGAWVDNYEFAILEEDYFAMKSSAHRDISALTLKPTTLSDIEIQFGFQLDPEANYLAAFTQKDPFDKQAYMEKYSKFLTDDTIHPQTIWLDGVMVGSIAKYMMHGDAQITYWIDKAYWGKGIASAAVKAFLGIESARPIFGCTAFDNFGSQRVLEKAGFVRVGSDRGFANGRNAEVEEFIYKLG